MENNYRLILLSIMLIMVFSCHKPMEREVISAKEHLLETCQNDSDCMTMKENCCGCNQGGKQKAIAKINKNMWTRYLDARCVDIMCMQIISHDLSCSQFPACINGHCQLK